jgi:hypothetical protein
LLGVYNTTGEPMWLQRVVWPDGDVLSWTVLGDGYS